MAINNARPNVIVTLVPRSRSLGYERVYLPRCKVADTPFYIQWDELDHTYMYSCSGGGYSYIFDYGNNEIHKK